jgi:hypothetical protein
MFYKDTTQSAIKEANWDEKSLVARQGGYSLINSNLPAGTREIAKGTPISISADGAQIIKTAKVYEAAAKAATSVKIEKGSLVAVGDTIAGVKVSAVEVGGAYDTLTVEALSAALKVGDVINAEISGTAALVVATVANLGTPDLAATLAVYEIEEGSLPYPINDTIKAALGALHVFKI